MSNITIHLYNYIIFDIYCPIDIILMIKLRLTEPILVLGTLQHWFYKSQQPKQISVTSFILQMKN